MAGLSVRYPGPGSVLALEGLDLAVAAGSFHAILGPSGCGKSTLLKVLGGLVRATAGEWRIAGGRRPAYVPQGNSCFPWLTAEANVAYGLWVQGRPRRERRAVARALLASLGLQEFAESYPHQLSEGMRQRVAIARAFAVNAPLLIMDEPLSALDFQTKIQVQGELLRLWSDRQATVLYVTHDIDEALTLADRVSVLSGRPGRLLGTIEVPFPRPRSYRDVRNQPGYPDAFRQLFELLEERSA
ncbi:MAG: ABC transporter ATP-binding protein [Dehalococcoidia bacterium]|nr:ABC transporter ATP-binding protein [Dehalococcoidia bacterium]